MPDCTRITTGYTFQDKEIVTPKKLNKALDEACINLDDILADIDDLEDDVDDIQDILDQLLNPPGGFGLVGVTIQQGTLSITNGPNITVGTINLILPAQRKWTHIEVYTTIALSSANQAIFSTIFANAVAQTGGTNLVVGRIYATNNDDDSQVLNHVFRYVPTSPLANQSITPVWALINIAFPPGFPQTSLYAVGHHEAVLT